MEREYIGQQDNREYCGICYLNKKLLNNSTIFIRLIVCRYCIFLVVLYAICVAYFVKMLINLKIGLKTRNTYHNKIFC